MSSRLRLSPVLAAIFCLAALASPPRHARAEMDNATWKAAQEDFARLFSERGFPEEKAGLLRALLGDAQARSLKLVGDALAKECILVWELRRDYHEASLEEARILVLAMDGYSREEEVAAVEVTNKLRGLGMALAVELKVLEGVIQAVRGAPPVLLETMLKRAQTSKDWTYRAAAARLAALEFNKPETQDFLRKTMLKDKDPRVRSAALEVIGNADGDWAPWVLDRVADADWTIQVQAISFLRERVYKPAVPHLINALGKATPRVAEAIGVALHTITGEKIEPMQEPWARWWEDHREAFEAGDHVGIKVGKQEAFKEVHFYGLTVKSDRVIFVIDTSGSMRHESSNKAKTNALPPPPETGGGQPPPPPPVESMMSGPKIDIARDELRKVIETLPESAKFTIVAFGTGVMAWRDKPEPATKANRQDALQWVRALKPEGVTYMEGALRRAFQIAGFLDVNSSYPEARADTIILVGDGTPTDNHPTKPKNADPEALKALVREWNSHKRIVIHTIGVDMVEHIPFLQELAIENGGTYVDR